MSHVIYRTVENTFDTLVSSYSVFNLKQKSNVDIFTEYILDTIVIYQNHACNTDMTYDFLIFL